MRHDVDVAEWLTAPDGDLRIDSGVFSVHAAIGDRDVVFDCYLCDECYAMVPVKAGYQHRIWHVHAEY